MKIAFVNMPWSPSVLPLPYVDSIGAWTAAIAQRLSLHHKILIYSRQSGAFWRVRNYGNIQFRRQWLWPDEFFIKPRVMRREGRAAIVSPFYYGVYVNQIARYLKRQNCDLVHIPCFPQFVTAVRRHNPKLKIILHCHEEWLVQFDRTQMEACIQQAELVLGCSQFLVDRFRHDFPEYADRFQVIHNGVDLAAFELPLPQPLSRQSRAPEPVSPNEAMPPKQLLFVGRVSPEKGVHVLLEAFARVVAQYPNVRLKIVGYDTPLSREFLQSLSDVPQVQSLVRFCDAHYGTTLRAGLAPEVADRIDWVGGLLHDEVIEALAQADVVINPSFYESFGNSVIEAMAAQRPVVVSAVGGMKDTVVPEETGLLVEPGDVDQLAASILRLLRDSASRSQMGQAGRRRVAERFTWDQIVMALLQQYEAVLAG